MLTQVWIRRPVLNSFSQPLRYPHQLIRVARLQCAAFNCTAHSHGQAYKWQRDIPLSSYIIGIIHQHTHSHLVFRLFCGYLHLAVHVTCPCQAHSNKLTRGWWLRGKLCCLQLGKWCILTYFSQFWSVEFLEHTHNALFLKRNNYRTNYIKISFSFWEQYLIITATWSKS